MNKIFFGRGDNAAILSTVHADSMIRVWDSRQLSEPLYGFTALN